MIISAVTETVISV